MVEELIQNGHHLLCSTSEVGPASHKSQHTTRVLENCPLLGRERAFETRYLGVEYSESDPLTRTTICSPMDSGLATR